LDEVTLTDRDFAPRRALAKQYIRAFDIDRLMHTFRLNAGIPSSAEPLGGWEAPDCGLRGHFVGHFLSACAKFAFADRDDELKSKADEIVAVIGLCARPNGYLSAFEEEALDVLEREENRNVWAPYYTLHKIMQGLIDSYTYLGNSEALTLAVNLARYIHARFEKLSYWQFDGILRCTKVNPANEFGGIGDALYTLYDITGDANVLELARTFDRDYLLGPLEAGVDVLDNLHANTHLPMVIAAMHRYDISGEAKYKTAALHFYDFVSGRTFANGNNSSKASAYIAGGVSERSEHWGRYGELGDALTGGESESCCAHNTERILERLTAWTGAVDYLNHLESLKYNAVLNSASSVTGLSQYHQPLGSGVMKKFSGEYDNFWCCTASGIEAMSELQKNIWFRSDDAVLVNAYISSTVDWRDRGVSITQQSEFPDRLTSTLTIETAEPAALALMLKADTVRAVKVNGVPVELKIEDGYVVLDREYRDKDRIEIAIEARLHRVPLLGNDRVAALKYGSVLLARIDDGAWNGVGASSLADRLVKRFGDRLAFDAADEQGNSATFLPLFRVEDETYSVYWDWDGDATKRSRFSHAKDGSTAYESA
jgi:uncharacterized protein